MLKAVIVGYGGISRAHKPCYERLEKEGKVLVVDPEYCFGVDTIKRDKEGMKSLYELGYTDGKKIEDFVNKTRAEIK